MWVYHHTSKKSGFVASLYSIPNKIVHFHSYWAAGTVELPRSYSAIGWWYSATYVTPHFCRVNRGSCTTQTSFAFEWAILLFELTIKVKPDFFISYHFLFAAKDSYEVLHCVKLVFSCPVIDSIDLEQIIEHCERFQLDQYVQKLKCLN